MRKSEVQEALASLYLRLNGYFLSGLVVHDALDVKTELDVLAVRFPYHTEPEREIACCQHLSPPSNTIDIIVGEVKGGSGILTFNTRFRQDPNAIRTTLMRIGAFSPDETDRICRDLPQLLDPSNMREDALPLRFLTSAGTAQLRFLIFTPEQNRPKTPIPLYLYSDDLLEFAWKCFRPQQARSNCATRYNYNLWGPLFSPIVRYFKDNTRSAPGTICDLYTYLKVSE